MSTPAEQVNIYDAKSRLSQLIGRVENGETVVISRYGRPVAQLVPFTPIRPDRLPGIWAGQVRIPGDFDAFDDEDAADWYGA